MKKSIEEKRARLRAKADIVIEEYIATSAISKTCAKNSVNPFLRLIRLSKRRTKRPLISRIIKDDFDDSISPVQLN